MADLLLKNGLICDGTGTSPFVGDVSVKDGKIFAVAPHLAEDSAETVDCAGLVVSPAFIDMHSHSDSWFRKDARCEAKLYQGVATEIVGQCGSSPFPRSVAQMTQVRRARERGSLSAMGSYQAGSFEKLRALLPAAEGQMSTNLVQLVGHNAIRRGVVGLVDRPAWPDEITLSSFLLEQALRQGCWGLSLGLGYVPGLFSEANELRELLALCHSYDALVTVHMRDEGERVFDSLEEMISLARETGARVHIAHLKLGAKAVWGQAPALYARIRQAQAEGVRLSADLYPYNACSTGLSSRLPEWAMDGGAAGATRLLREDAEARARILALFRAQFPAREDGERFYIVSTGGRDPALDGRTVGQLSEQWGMPVPEAMIETLIRTGCEDDCIIFNMDEQDVHWLLAQPDLAIGSDASCRPFDPAASDGKPHPRTYGTFPRFLRLCREQGLCPLETAVRRITALPAGIVGLQDRGLLRPGMAADLTVFDGQTIADTASYDAPFQKPVGVHHVLMDGVFALRGGAQTSARCGRYLLKNNG